MMHICIHCRMVKANTAVAAVVNKHVCEHFSITLNRRLMHEACIQVWYMQCHAVLCVGARTKEWDQSGCGIVDVCVCVWRVKTNAKDGGASFLVSSALQCLHYPMCLEYIRSHHVCGVYVDLCMRCMNITLLSYPFFIKKCNIRCVYHTSICYACIHACNTDENKNKKT